MDGTLCKKKSATVIAITLLLMVLTPLIHLLVALWQKEKTGQSLSFLFGALFASSKQRRLRAGDPRPFAYSEQPLDAEKKTAKVSPPHLRFLALIHMTIFFISPSHCRNLSKKLLLYRQVFAIM